MAPNGLESGWLSLKRSGEAGECPFWRPRRRPAQSSPGRGGAGGGERTKPRPKNPEKQLVRLLGFPCQLPFGFCVYLRVKNASCRSGSICTVG
jgi:hypothetical protein